MTRINKLTALIGTLATVMNPEVTAYILSGWRVIRQVDTGHVLMRKER